jgi:hypothetical protein
MRAENIRLVDEMRWHEREHTPQRCLSSTEHGSGDLVDLQVEVAKSNALEGRAKLLEQYNRQLESHVSMTRVRSGVASA